MAETNAERLEEIKSKFGKEKHPLSLSPNEIQWLIEQADEAKKLKASILEINEAVSFYESKDWKTKTVVEFLTAKALGQIK